MAFPMQPTVVQVPGPSMNYGQAAPTPPWSQASNGGAQRGYAPAPGGRQPYEGENVSVDDFYDNMEQVPAAPVSSSSAPPTSPGGFGIATAAEWTPAERPIIRPPVSGASGNAGNGGNAGSMGNGGLSAGVAPNGPPPQRRMSQMSARPGDDLGVEESEFDKPTYLRRGLYAPE
jgi:hypothetical protein